MISIWLCGFVAGLLVATTVAILVDVTLEWLVNGRRT